MTKKEQEITSDDKFLENLESDGHDESLPHSLRRSIWLVQDEEDNQTYYC